MDSLLLYFEDERAPALRLAQALDMAAACIERHRFPDQELRLRLPLVAGQTLPAQLLIYRSLDRPNEKLIELLLVAEQARSLGARRLLLVAPYLAYMRQDMAFAPGEVVSQKVIGAFIARHFDALVTVDPHLHRIARLSEAVPLQAAVALSAAPLLGRLLAERLQQPLLIGPDAESAQWIEAAAAVAGLEHGVCAKQRRGDREVEIELPAVQVRGRQVALLDDVASSGRTLAGAAEQLLAAGAASVDVAVTHGLFAGDALAVIEAAGVGRVWSSDSVAHPSNSLALAPLLADALRPLLDATFDAAAG